MQIKDLTKRMFADTLVDMLKDMPLDKVRVTKLCERCGTTSPTFYYYFRDKYELVVWIFLQDIVEIYSGTKPGRRKKNELISKVKMRKTFYQKAFTDQSQNSLSEYMQSFIIDYYTEAVLHDTGDLPTQDQLMAIKYHTYGLLGMFREWLFGRDMSFEEKYVQLFERAPDFLKKAFVVYPMSSDSIMKWQEKAMRTRTES